MSQLVDGPAGPLLILNERSPRFLRVVVDPKGKVDTLDQLEDVAAADEAIHVYEVVPGTTGDWAFITLARPKRCIRTSMASYRHRADVDGESMRDTATWREWCLAEQAAHA